MTGPGIYHFADDSKPEQAVLSLTTKNGHIEISR